MKHRFYKREVPLRLEDTPLLRGDAYWDAFFREIVRRGFNGFVLYPDYHPFQHLLDYKGFPLAAAEPAARRRQVRAHLNRVLALAHVHGLQTFMQHYVGHITPALARHIGLSFAESESTRLAHIRHPEAARYQRYCYREIFTQCPDLDGLYFNYESVGADAALVIETAVREAQAMPRKPVFLHRLWGFNAPPLMAQIIRAYDGPSLVSHKIQDTSDAYYFARADSRIREWKRALPGTDFLYVIGPCHNCAANLARILWSDYDFVWDLLADGARQGCDGISFHQVNDAVSADHILGRLNTLHLEAVTDFLAGRRRSRRAQAACLGARVGAAPASQRDLFDAVRESSRPNILAHQQFCMSSAVDGWLNPGRLSLTQEPFFYYPATEMNDQTRPMWRPIRADTSWLQKRLRTRVTPPRYTQYLLDAANPREPPATLPPREIARRIGAACDRAEHAFRRFAARNPKPLAAQIAPWLDANLIPARHVQHEIHAMLPAYGLYFDRDRRLMIRHLDQALRHVRRDLRVKPWNLPAKVRCWYRGMPAAPTLERLERLKVFLAADAYSLAAFRAFVRSHREFNEIRRRVRALRLHDPDTLLWIRGRLERAEGWARHALRAADRDEHREAIVPWLEYLRRERERTVRPRLACPRRGLGDEMPLDWDNCFRAGEDFLDDFLGFFLPLAYTPPAPLSFRIGADQGRLAIELRERGVNTAARRRRWQEFGHAEDATHNLRLFFDPDRDQRRVVVFHVLPMGGAVFRTGFSVLERRYLTSEPRERLTTCPTCYREERDGYRLRITIPFREIGADPGRGAAWGFNLTAAPAIERNRQYTWAAQYDSGIGNPWLFGALTWA